jgi:trimeric autotransporter adhesin
VEPIPLSELPPGYITTFAGGTLFEGGGTLAKSVPLQTPSGIAVDALGNIYVADTYNNRIRRIDALTGILTTVAGKGMYGYAGDGGPAIAASLFWPEGVTLDPSGNLLIADSKNIRIRKVDAKSGIIQTIAGTGQWGRTGDGGPATDATFGVIQGLALDAAGNIFVADFGCDTCSIRRIDSATGIISTSAGTGSCAFSGDGGPANLAGLSPFELAFDKSGNLVFCDYWNGRVRRVAAGTQIITTIAGTGGGGYYGDGQAAQQTKFDRPTSLCFDESGNLFIADGGSYRIRKIDSILGIVSTLAGNGIFGSSGGWRGCSLGVAQP